VRAKAEEHQRKREQTKTNQEPRGTRGQRAQREEREDGCVARLGGSNQGRPEGDDTLTMISHGVEISIAAGEADEKDEGHRGLFLFFLLLFFTLFFLYHIFVLKVQEIAWSASYAENKTQNPKRANKGNITHQKSSTGVRTGPRPTYGRQIQTSKSRKTLPKPTGSIKNKNINLGFLRRHKISKGNYIRRTGGDPGGRGRRS